MQLQHIAGGPGKRRNDCRLPTGKPIEQGRLARVRRAGNGDPQALPQPLPAPRAGPPDLLGERSDERQCLRHGRLGDIVLVRKVDAGFHQRERLDQPLTPGLGPLAEQSAQVLVGLPALRLGLRGDKIGKPLHGRQVDAAVLEGATGELARLGGAQSRKLPQCGKRRRYHGPAAMDLQLRYVLPGLAVGAGKPQREPLVDHLRPDGIAHPRERCMPRLRQPPNDGLQRRSRMRAGNADHRNGCRRPSGGKGEDGVALGCHLRSLINTSSATKIRVSFRYM